MFRVVDATREIYKKSENFDEKIILILSALNSNAFEFDCILLVRLLLAADLLMEDSKKRMFALRYFFLLQNDFNYFNFSLNSPIR